MQSYVDIFLSGCIELQERVSDPDVDFVDQCVLTTDGWSKHWVNDRIYPRRPYQHQRNAFQIDRVLRKHMPELVEAIRMATLTPARVIGVDDRKGSLEERKDADIVIFEDDFTIWRTMIGGRWITETQ